MTVSEEKFLLARVDVPAAEALHVVADRLSGLMPGFALKEELTGRYDEVPAFVAEHDEVEFVLLGIPDGESGDNYELKFRCETSLPIEVLLARDAGGFLRQFVSGKLAENKAFVDFSEELAQVLVQHGIKGSKPIRPVAT